MLLLCVPHRFFMIHFNFLLIFFFFLFSAQLSTLYVKLQLLPIFSKLLLNNVLLLFPFNPLCERNFNFIIHSKLKTTYHFSHYTSNSNRLNIFLFYLFPVFSLSLSLFYNFDLSFVFNQYYIYIFCVVAYAFCTSFPFAFTLI